MSRWVEACFVCGYFIYWDDESLSWCHLWREGFKITHTAHVAKVGGHTFDPFLVIQEEP